MNDTCKKLFVLINWLFFIIRSGLENVKQIIEQRVTQTTSDNDIESLAFEKKQYDLLLSQYEFFYQIFRLVFSMFSYDHELKIQKARENARRTEKEKEAERYDVLMHDFLVRL